MTDAIGHIGSASTAYHGAHAIQRAEAGGTVNDVAPVKQQLQQQIEHVNGLQQDASKAIEEIAAGRRGDLQSVMAAKEKAAAAVAMLMDVRSKVASAYEELSRFRV